MKTFDTKVFWNIKTHRLEKILQKQIILIINTKRMIKKI